MALQIPMPVDLQTRRAQMFPALTPEEVARVSACGVEKSFEDGAIVFDQGEENIPLYVVLKGELAIVLPHGKFEDLITVHREREFAGDISILADRRTIVRGRANGPLRVLRIEHARLRSLLQTDPELSDVLMRAFILRRVALLSVGASDVVVVGSRDSAATLRLQGFLLRNGHPYHFVDVDRDPDVQKLLDEVHVDARGIPILICQNVHVLKNPSDSEVAECLGFNAALSPAVVRDVVICGAGPSGLAAAVYGASEGLDVLVVEAGAPGGQAASSSKIENYLGFPTGVSGQALAARALAQAEKFGAILAVTRGAMRIDCNEVPMRIELAGGESVRARTVILATGVEYRKLDVPDLAKFEGAGIYYAATAIEAQRCAEDEVVVVGGGNSAGQGATFLARKSRRVTMLVRGPDLASSMSRYLIRRIEETPNITLHRSTRIVALKGGEHLEAVTWRDDKTGEETTRAVRHVFSMTGARPNTDWLRGAVALDEKGFVRTDIELTKDILEKSAWPLARSPYLFETSRPHVFAVGDVRANNVKRVASAVGEGSVCIQLVHRALGE